MGFLNIFKRSESAPPRIEPTSKYKRGYSGAKMTSGMTHWIWNVESADSILKSDLRILRGRSRDLAMNDPYITYYLTMISNNVVGPQGFKLQLQIPDQKIISEAIEKTFRIWSRKGNCTVCGAYSFASLCRLAIETIARDGEILIRKIYKDQQFLLQLIEADHLDETYSTVLSNGNTVRMGVEYNAYSKPMAYHIFTAHPGDTGFVHKRQQRIRIPAKEMLHIYKRTRPSQSRGVPWIAPVMTRVKNMNGFDESAMINARFTAAKQGFYTKPHDHDDGYEGKEDIVPETPSEFTAGTIDELPAGWDFKAYDSKYPDAQYGPFKKAFLQSIASGLGVSYNNLAKDLENVNFSSIRQGTLDDRDVWRTLQFWLIEELSIPVFTAWLNYGLLSESIELPSGITFDQIAMIFKPRGWSWIDPLKDIKANKESVAAGFKSASDVVDDQGGDIEDVYFRLRKEQDLRAENNITVDLAPVLEIQEEEDNNGKKED